MYLVIVTVRLQAPLRENIFGCVVALHLEFGYSRDVPFEQLVFYSSELDNNKLARLCREAGTTMLALIIDINNLQVLRGLANFIPNFVFQHAVYAGYS